jgi:hypothetical protein
LIRAQCLPEGERDHGSRRTHYCDGGAEGIDADQPGGGGGARQNHTQTPAIFPALRRPITRATAMIGIVKLFGLLAVVSALVYSCVPRSGPAPEFVDIKIVTRSDGSISGDDPNKHPYGKVWHLRLPASSLKGPPGPAGQYAPGARWWGIPELYSLIIDVHWPSFTPAGAHEVEENKRNKTSPSAGRSWPYVRLGEKTEFYAAFTIIAEFVAEPKDRRMGRGDKFCDPAQDPVKQTHYQLQTSQATECATPGDYYYTSKDPTLNPYYFDGMGRSDSPSLAERHKWNTGHASLDGWSVEIHMPLGEIEHAPELFGRVKDFLDKHTVSRDSLRKSRN